MNIYVDIGYIMPTLGGQKIKLEVVMDVVLDEVVDKGVEEVNKKFIKKFNEGFVLVDVVMLVFEVIIKS